MKKEWMYAFILVMVVFSGCTSNSQKEKAMVIAALDMWGRNQEKPDELLVNLFVYNYGDAAAKNVRVTCILMDSEYNKIATTEAGVGDIEARSVDTEQVAIRNPWFEDIEDLLMQCYASGCEDCMLLEDHIPELVENRENPG